MVMVGILILGLILRLINLNQSLWLDEAISVLTARNLTTIQILTQFAPKDFHPPLHYLLLHFWGKIFGWSEISMRMPSVLFGVATVYVVYLISKWGVGSGELGDKKTLRLFPIIAASFMATAPFHIYYSQEARMYAMTAFLASLSMYYFLKPTTNHQPPVIGYALATALLLYSHYFGFFILLTQVIIALLRKKHFLLLNSLVALLLFTPWLPMLFTQLQYGSQAIQSLPEWGRLVNVDFLKALPLTFIKFSIGRITIFNKKLYAAIAGILFLIYGGIIGKVVNDQWPVIRKKKKLDTGHPPSASRPRPVGGGSPRRGRGCWLVTILLWLFVPILVSWLLSLFIPNYQPFRLLLVLPAFYLLLAYGISQFQGPTIRTVLTLVILGVNLISLSVYYFNPYFHREDWRGVVKYVESYGAKNSAAILPSKTSNWPWRYYTTGKVKMVDMTNLTIQQFNNKTILYIRYLVPLFDPQEKISSWLNENNFVKIKEISFNQIPLWIYQRLEGS